MQRCLVRDEHFSCQPLLHEVSAAEVMKELGSFFANHTASVNKNLDFSPSVASPTFRTNLSLLLRVLCNMVTNALEATAEGGLVRVWTDQPPGLLSFCVWNDTTIPEDIARRVFQRNFSTKEGDGRELGTYSMKLFGEKFLGGEAGFITSRKEGTIFRISLPVE
jgi:signal transduction histidine kinase